jgi:hypothetical protein
MSRLDAALVLHPSVQKNNAVAAAASNRRVANASETGRFERFHTSERRGGVERRQLALKGVDGGD